VPLIRAMRKVVDIASKPLAEEFKQLTGGLKFTQIDKLKSWMMDRGVTLPDMRKETLDAVFGETEDGEELDASERLDLELPPDVDRALRIRRLIGSASIKKLDAMEACVMSDSRARGLLLYHGAGPGRWAGKLIQPHNFPRGSVIEDDRQVLVDAIMTGDPGYVECLYGPAVEAVVSSLRHTIVAAPGHTLVAGDFAGIEARVVLALSGQHDKCALLASGADVYIDMACDIFGVDKLSPTDPRYKEWCKEFKRDHLEWRQTGKNSVLGCGFQMGDNKFHDRYCPDQELEFATRVIQAYRKDWAPKVPELWRGLERAAIRTVHESRPHEAYGVEFRLEDEWMTARLPSGRKLWYFRPRPTRKAMPWDEDDIRLSWSYVATKLGRRIRVDAYGGLLTENVVQALARDLLRAAMLKCRKERLPIILTVHDEIVLEVPEARADEKALAQIMGDIPDWARAIRVPVDTDTWVGDRYRK
jgi:DNA polymerase